MPSHVQLCNLWAVTHQAPLSMAFPRQEYWSGSPYPPPPGDLPDPGHTGLLYYRKILYRLSHRDWPEADSNCPRHRIQFPSDLKNFSFKRGYSKIIDFYGLVLFNLSSVLIISHNFKFHFFSHRIFSL